MARSSTVIGLRFPLLICELFTPLKPEIYPAQEIGKGNRNFAHLERLAIEELTIRGWDAEYVAVRLATDLKLPDSMEDREQPLVVLAAARLGKTRLLDRAQPATDHFVPLRRIYDRPAREMP